MFKKKQKDPNEISAFRKVREVCSLLFRGTAKKYPFFFVLEAFYTILDAVNPFIGLTFTPLIIDELLTDQRIDRLILYVVSLVGGKALCSLLMNICDNVLNRYQERLNNFYYMEIARHAMELDFELTEDKKCLDQMEKAKTGMGWYSGGVYGIAQQFFYFIGNVVKIFGFITLISLYAPILLVMVALYVLVNALLVSKVNALELKNYSRLSVINRVFNYYGWEISDFKYGKDIRLYEAQDMLLARWKQTYSEGVDVWRSQTEESLPYRQWGNVTGMVRTFFTYFWAGLLVIKSVITIGTATQLIEATGALDATLGGLVWNVQELIKRSNYAYEYVLYTRYPERLSKGTRQVPAGNHVIAFEHVSFAYPGTDKLILDDISIQIKPGEKLSIVGLNGAGKTTFIKLLCRLYDPTEGRILLDGVDIREYDLNSYIEYFAPVFQDFRLFAFSMQENISCKDDELLTEEEKERCREILVRLEMQNFLEKLPNGLATKNYKIFDETGVEPSGGEQQKLALARALYKNSSALILDEPTAALDPIAEYEIYKKFNELVEQKTAFYISHRLSSCKFCDKIAVFSEGKIAEYGKHDDLVAISNGIYAEMFEAQAQYYR